MFTKETERSILLSEYKPKSELHVEEHQVTRARFPVLDIHAHFGGLLLGPDYASRYDTATVVDKLRRHGVQGIVDLELCWGDELWKAMEKTRTDDGFITTFGSVDVTGLDDDSFGAAVDRTLLEYQRRGVRGLKLWKNIGLGLRDRGGALLRVDDPRLGVIWRTAAALDMPVLLHVADPVAFFRPVDGANEQYEALRENPEWSFTAPGLPTYEQLMDAQERLLQDNPGTTFIIAHVGSCGEDLARAGSLLDRFPNLHVDIAARLNELGRQPYTARRFFTRYADRILFGTDFVPDSPELAYPYYFRFLETFDEHFDYGGTDLPDLGRWRIYGIGLDDEVLRKVYGLNAARLLRRELPDR
jgi:hypothetical protein